MIAQLLQQPDDHPKIVRFTRTGIVIPLDYRQIMDWDDPDSIEQRTLRGRVVGIPTVTWKKYMGRRTTFSPWPNSGKCYLMVRLATRRHGVLTLPLPPSSADDFG